MRYHFAVIVGKKGTLICIVPGDSDNISTEISELNDQVNKYIEAKYVTSIRLRVDKLETLSAIVKAIVSGDTARIAFRVSEKHRELLLQLGYGKDKEVYVYDETTGKYGLPLSAYNDDEDCFRNAQLTGEQVLRGNHSMPNRA